jgi:hypothetical protein
MTKTIISVLFLFALACSLLPSVAQAQTNFIFSSFQCDPGSCKNQTTAPVFQGTVTVTFNGTCTGGAVAGIEAFATSFVGVPGPCEVPYTPFAQVEVSRETLLDDFGCPYDVDTETNIADVLDVLGNVVFNTSSSTSCDGSTSGPFTVGTRPC